MFDYSKLNGRIREIFGTQAAFSDAMGMSRTTMSFKLNNNSEFSQTEMIRAMELLKLPLSLIDEYFFCV